MESQKLQWATLKQIFMQNITPLVDYTFFPSPADAELKDILHMMLQNYSNAMKIIWKQSDYTEDDITNFQLKIDNFFSAHIELSGTGKEGITNNLHLQGYLMYYVKVHRKLYRYSQQDW